MANMARPIKAKITVVGFDEIFFCLFKQITQKWKIKSYNFVLSRRSRLSAMLHPKVRQSRKKIMVSSILQKNKQNSLSWAYSLLRIVSFVRFLEKLRRPQIAFEINLKTFFTMAQISKYRCQITTEPWAVSTKGKVIGDLEFWATVKNFLILSHL